MANKIIIKRSSVAGKIPLSTDLEVGELAVNLVDKVLFTKNASGDVVPLDQDVDYYIKASSAITKGQVVMFTGAVGASGNLTGAPATGLTAETAYAVMGIAAADIALNDWGYVTAFGNVKGVDTSAFSDGQILYLNPSVAGGLTATIPTAPNPKVQVCAVASAASNGTLVVRPTFGGKLGQFEGDVQITSPTSGDALVWDGSKWANTQITGYVDADVDAHLNTATATTGQVLSWSGTDYDWVDQSGGGVPVGGTTGQVLAKASATDYDTTWVNQSGGTVTSVAMTVPTGLLVSGTPITTSGTFEVTLASGYSIPTTTSQTNWDSAYSQRLQWDGGSTNLAAATGRTSLGATTVGSSLFTLTNPSAITFPRFNADNTVSALSAADFRAAIGAGTSSTTGTVTSVGGTGTVSGLTLTGTVTTSGNLTLGGTLAVTPSNFTSQNANTFLAAPNGAAGVPTFRAIVAADVPTLNQNTTGSAATLTTARTIQTNLALTSSASFNGSANITPGVTGTLGVSNGGTGLSSLTANGVLLGNGTSAVQTVAPGASGNVLTSNGSTWVSQPAGGSSLTGRTSNDPPGVTAIGVNAGVNDALGSYNTYLGNSAGQTLYQGNNNTILGYKSGYTNYGGSQNTWVGTEAGYTANSSNNTAVGYRASYGTTGSSNVAVGDRALSASSGSGSLNVAVGEQALAANTSAGSNVAVGSSAMLLNTTGGFNVAVGPQALRSNTTGQLNIAVGNQALRNNTIGTNNTATGSSALRSNSTGNDNTAVGYWALLSSTASSNTALGAQAGFEVSSGAQNTLVGHQAGYTGTNNLTTGSNNILIGYRAQASSSTVSNEITLGNSSIATLRCQVTTITSLSDARDKTNVVDLDAGLALINAVRPVAFDWHARDGAKVGVADTGFIAQELQAAQEAVGVVIPGLVYAENPEKLEAGYGKLLPVMVKAIQELSAKVDALQSELNALKGV